MQREYNSNMKRTLLYYPTMNIPNNEWIRNALLYWDELGSIIPEEYLNKSILEPHILYLIDEGIFIPKHTNNLELHYSKGNWMDNFADEFKTLIMCDEFKKLLPTNLNFANKIYHGILLDKVLNFLKENKLAQSINEDWIEIEEYTSLIYMSILAKYLASFDDNNVSIGTDFPIYHSLMFKPVNNDIGTSYIANNMNGVFPVPSLETDIKDIIKFRKKRRDNLLHFRQLINEFENSISKAESIEEIKEKLNLFSENLELGVSDISRILKDSKIEMTISSIKSLIDIKSPTLLTSMAMLIDSTTKIVDLPLKISLPGLAIMSSIQLFHNYIQFKKNNILRKSPHAYLYYAQKEGYIKSTHNTL